MLKKNNKRYSRKTNQNTENRLAKQILATYQNSITNLFANNFTSDGAIYELNEIKMIEEKINRDDLIYKSDNKTYDFQKFKIAWSFGREI